MATAVQTITDRVRARIRADGTDLARDRSRAADYVRDEVRRYSERALGSADPLLEDEQDAAAQVLAALTGFGPLQPLLDDDEVEEIWINSTIPLDHAEVEASVRRRSAGVPRTVSTRP